jgi:hypothetical protein
MASPYYEIRVAGTLPPEAQLDFERLSASVEPFETVVHGPLPDQAALHGLLARLETFGVQILDIHRLHGESPPPELAQDRESGLPSRGSSRPGEGGGKRDPRLRRCLVNRSGGCH